MRFRSLLAMVAAVAAVLPHSARAQAAVPAASDSVLARIWTLGMDSSQTERLAQVLLDSLGPRLTGTPEAKRANDWLVKTYQGWGIEARNEKFGTWRSWRRGPSHIDLLSPRVRTLDGTMLGYSPGTNGKPLVATTIVLPRFADSTEFVKWLPNAKGRLVLVSAPPATCRPSEDWKANGTAASAARMDSTRVALRREWGGRNVRGTGYSLALGGGELGVRLEQGGAAGVISARPKDGWGAYEIFETYNTKAPNITLSCEDYGLVFRLTENGQAPKLRLDLDAQLLGEQPVFNTVAELRGSAKPDEYVMLSAHFDSWDGSSGATDNGTGTLTMLEAMRILKQVYPHPKRTILVGHWAGEEEGEVGSKSFAEDHPEVVKGLQALFNQDNGTGRVVNIDGGGLPDAAAHLQRWYARLPQAFQSQIQFGGVGMPAGGGSDDFSFNCRGLPAFGLNSTPFNYGSYTWHTNLDSYDKIVFDDLKANATLTAMLAYLASEDSTFVTREKVDLAQAVGALPPEVKERAARFGYRFPTTWPECGTAPRSTKPRLK